MNFPAAGDKSVLIVTVLLVPVLALPLHPSIADTKSNDAQKGFEVIEGPREFYVPLVPLPDTALPQSLSSETSSKVISLIQKSTDLDYIVYGKLYLIKALKRPDRSVGSSRSEHTTEIQKLHQDQSSISNTRSNDGISFPAVAKAPRRLYRYKSRNIQNQGLPNEQESITLGRRKIEERSAEQMNGANQTIDTTKSVSDNIKTEENFDEEELELLQKHTTNFPNAVTVKLGNDTNVHDSNSTGENVDIVDRFLINVPNKPVSIQCPEGQKRTHFGICKTISVHRPSPSDGFFEGRLVAASSPQKKEHNNSLKNNPRDEIQSLHLTSLFRSVVQLERKLEKAIKDTERQLLADARVQEGRGPSIDTTEKA